MTKHELVCATYVVASDQVRQLSGLIRIEFSKCSAAKAKASGRDPIEMEPCLFEHYQQMAAAPRTYGTDPDCPELDCEFCEKADRFIQQRKKARKRLGAAKRQITLLGKAAIKNVAVNHD